MPTFPTLLQTSDHNLHSRDMFDALRLCLTRDIMCPMPEARIGHILFSVFNAVSDYPVLGPFFALLQTG